jgi:serralysin
VFVFDTKPNKKTNVDKITDFSARYDSIWLSDSIFKSSDLKKIGKGRSEDNPGKLKAGFFKSFDKKHPLAQDKNDYVLYNKSTGALSYDADGSGKSVAIQIASLSKNLKLTAKDFFII